MDIRFDRQDTKAIKGIAVIMMLFCHLVASPDRFPAGFENFSSVIPGFIERGYLLRIGLQCGLCVPFFFFLGGYGLYFRMQKSGFSLKNIILNLYYAYWKVFVIFIPIGFLFFSRDAVDISQYTTRFASYRGMELITVLISDFTALTCKLNGEWWFFSEYVGILLWGYLFCKLIDKVNDFWAEIMIVVVIDAVIRSIVPMLPTIGLFSLIKDNLLYANFLRFNSLSSSFFMGIVMAKHNGVCVLKRMLKGIPFHSIICLGSMIALVLLRSYVMGEVVDIIICSLMIPMLSLVLDALSPVKKFFAYMGKHSTNMWLVHSFFCFYFLEFTKLVYCTDNVLIGLTILTALSWISSVLLNAFYSSAGKMLNRLQAEKKAKTA